MLAVPPITITDAMLITPACAEPYAGEPAAYNAGTNYAADATVSDTTQHRIYTSLQAGNLGHPLPVLPATSTDWWDETATTNRWAMFDTLRNSATTVATPLAVKITPGARVDSVALFGLAGSSVTVELKVGGVSQYIKTQSLIIRNITTWYEYFFKPFSTKKSFAVFDIPPLSGDIYVTITATSGNVSCAGCVLGLQTYIGETQYNPENDALNFSTINRNVSGAAELIQRRSVPKTTQVVWTNSENVDKLLELRDLANALPVVWSGLNDATQDYFGACLIFGIYKQFKIDLTYPDKAVVTLELEDLN